MFGLGRRAAFHSRVMYRTGSNIENTLEKDRIMLQLEKIFQDHMMLQRNCENRIYGKDLPHEKIRLLFQNQVYESKSTEEGNWEIVVGPLPAGGPYSMLFLGSCQIEIKDVMIGDLYFLSGQSNMEMKLTETIDVTRLDTLLEIPSIRFLSVVPNYIFQEGEEVLPLLSWKQAVKANFSDMSAIGYFFALEITENQNVPIGLIQTAVGGSSIEAWMKRETLNKLGNSCEEIAYFLTPHALETIILKQMTEKERWMKPILQEKIPAHAEWEDWYLSQTIGPCSISPYYGSIWLKREIYLEEKPAEDGVLRLGLMIDGATIWINNHYVGSGLHRYEMLNFPVCKDILQQGRNEIMVRLVIENGVGGFVPQKPYRLTIGPKELDLSGIWKTCKGTVQKEKAPDVLFPPLFPLGLFYGVLRPLRHLQFRAILWYQGESNVGHPEDYKTMFYEMKADWEQEFRRPLSFCCVQLANYQDPLNQVTDTGWAKIRNDQRRCRKEVSSSPDRIGVITAMDLGEKTDLHPHNKKEVAYRLSLWVRRQIYGEEICCHGPVLSTYERIDDKIILYFKYDDSILQEITNFEILTEVGEWRPVKALHRPGQVEIMLPESMKPKNAGSAKPVIQVRYGWYDNPGPLNFYNSDGLPAESFFLEIE
ncbi:sialate O-acetylesterase [Kineothrix alysoides]|nr:sialate O-acetylesterase [Kineothrix alysoides]